MRSVLPDTRHVNGHGVIEGAIAAAQRHLLAQIGQEIGVRLSAAAEHVLGRAPYVRRGHVSYSVEQTRAAPNAGPCRASALAATGVGRGSS